MLETEQGMLMVKGTDLHVNRVNLEKGEIDLSGNIESISYSDIQSPGKQAESLFGKLFRWKSGEKSGEIYPKLFTEQYLKR